MTETRTQQMSVDDVAAFFDSCLAARESLKRLRLRRKAIEDSIIRSPKGGVPSGGPGDPTARTAQRLMGLDESEREAEEYLASKIAECERVCVGVGKVKGYDKGIMLADHYISGETWDTIARDFDVHISTVIRWRDSIFEWISFVGLAAAAEGIGRAEQRGRQ